MVTPNRSINEIRRLLMWLALALIILLAILSIWGAFKGAGWSQWFFNSPPLVAFWLLLTILLIAAILAFPRLRGKFGLLAMHLGCVLLLFGAIWGSQQGHLLQKSLFGSTKVPRGFMIIQQGGSDHTIVSENQQPLVNLPFSLYLQDFRIEYYHNQPGKLIAQLADSSKKLASAQPGEELLPGPEMPKIKILRLFQNLQISLENGKKIITDQPQTGENPALEIELTWPDGKAENRYIFAQFPEFGFINNNLKLTYALMVRDYLSEVEVKQGDQTIKHQIIEVNKPLHYGGYYFYQSSYDLQHGRYTILSITSDTGLKLIFTGCVLLCIGLFWQLWLRHLITYCVKPSKTRTKNEYGD